jgi:general secretion pathway protein I
MKALRMLDLRRLRSAYLARASGGFTLLEVMVAVAILGLTLTVILSAQGGLAASNKIANNMGQATGLGRCKMTELEEKLLKMGYPEVDDLQTDISCCDDKDNGRFTCDTRVEKVLLPNPPDNTLGDGGSMLALSGPASSASAGGAGALGNLPGPIGSIAAQAMGPAGGASLNFDGGLAGMGAALGDQLGGAGAGGAGAAGMLQMVMGMVYPSLKPMMEASIRRLTVKVKWKEGPNEKELSLVQYVTSPQRGGFVAGAVPSGSAPLPNGPAPGGNTFGGSSPSPFGGGK